jgi:hypothetical protein
MIPSTNSKLLVAEDWKKIYQTFRNSDFTSYDFDTLRRTAVQYLRENYPEDFNDYIDSSEYIALVDLIAFLGQNLSFRIDLNARENFLETAQRRDSVLRLAQLVSYNPSRNVPASGFLKVTAITTTDNVIDVNGVNLANQVVGWNDPTNTNWYQQFISIMNSAMPGSFTFGQPYDKATIGGIATEQYRLNTANIDVPVYGFQQSINGTNMPFELTGCLFSGKKFIYEDAPLAGNTLSLIFQNDNQGAGSSTTGFFVHFRQGTLNYSDFAITNPVANELIGINASNINDTDVWLWQDTSNGTYSTLWTKVPSVIGNNVIYNSLGKDVRNIYSVASRADDQIDLNFADGSFGNLPKGKFRLFYRQSNGLTYSITPEQLSGISVSIPYYNKGGQANTLKLTLSLQYTVSNSSGAETSTSIKQKAPQTYYMQDRMITAEDYQIGPLTVGTDILKVKSINRASSGISKYFELSDVTGKYSSTNIFCDDGIIYEEQSQQLLNFKFTTKNDLFGTLKSKIEPIVQSPSFKNFYMKNYPRPALENINLSWVAVNNSTNQTTGYFKNAYGTAIETGYFSSNNMQYFAPGALVKFKAPINYYFLPTGKLTQTKDDTTTDYIWTKAVQVIGDGGNSGKGLLNDGTGPITLTGNVPSTAIPVEIIPAFVTTWSYALENQIVNLGLINRNFGLSFDSITRQWFVVVDTNLDLKNPFDLIYQKDVTNSNKDASWMIAFQWTGNSYNVYYRILDYLFESAAETAFYIDKTSQNYDFINNKVVKDTIKVLSINYATQTYTPAEIGINSVVGPVTAVSIIQNGTGYSNVVAQTNGGQGSGLTVSLLTSGGVITGTNIISHGYGYSINDRVSVLGGDGLASLSITSIGPGSIGPSGLNIISSGTGYTSTPSISIPGGGTFEAIPLLVNGSIDSVRIINSGSNITINSQVVVANTNQEILGSAMMAHLGQDYNWQIDSAVIDPDGYVEPKKVKISFYDATNDGAIDNPDAFTEIASPYNISPQTGYLCNFVYFKTLEDGLRYVAVDPADFVAYPSEVYVPTTPNLYNVGQKIYFYDSDVVKSVQTATTSNGATIYTFVLEPSYFAKAGRGKLKFQYQHNAGEERRLDPSKSNIIDVYLLSSAFDTAYRAWLSAGSNGAEPTPPSSNSLEEQYAPLLEPIKSVSDTIVYHNAKYKVLFGKTAPVQLQGTFKAVQSPTSTLSTNQIATGVLTAIDQFFAVENWEFGQTFNFGELATYVINTMTPDITNFVLVPKTNVVFGSLFEISCQSNEIFVSGASINDIEVISALTASQINTTASIVVNTIGT